jgi:hypothetical protein
MGNIFESVKKEILSWPHVTAESHRFGGLDFKYTAIMFLLIGIITTSILSIFTLELNQNQAAMAQQQPTLEGTSFQIDNVTFSHHMGYC